MAKVIFIESVHEVLHQRLEAVGYACDCSYDAMREELLAMAHEYSGVVVRSRIKIDKAFIDAACNLRFIARSGSGL